MKSSNFLHPLFHKFDIETCGRIMVRILEKQARELQERGFDPQPALSWLNEILPLLRQMRYSDHKIWPPPSPLPEDELQKHWVEFVILFFEDIEDGR